MTITNNAAPFRNNFLPLGNIHPYVLIFQGYSFFKDFVTVKIISITKHSLNNNTCCKSKKAIEKIALLVSRLFFFPSFSLFYNFRPFCFISKT